MTRTDIINHLLKNKKNAAYLEIGVRNPLDNFYKINCEDKDGVDPTLEPAIYNQGRGFQTVSDVFFSNMVGDKKYDVIFIDGLHVQEQVDKDIANSLNCLKEEGYIVLHDCNPFDAYHEYFHLCGTVWRSIYKLRKETSDLSICVVDTDYGCGVVTRGKATPMNVVYSGEVNYSFLSEFRKEILNLITVEEFKSKFFEITDPSAEAVLVSKYTPDKNKLINFSIPTFNGGAKLEVIINCLLAQTSDNYHITIVSDGKEPATELQLQKYFELPNFSYYHTSKRYNDYGHSPRIAGLETSECPFSIMTGFDNYYVPIFVETFENVINADPSVGFVFCDFLLDHPRHKIKYNEYVKAELVDASIDMGCFAAKTSLMKEFGLMRDKFNADWHLANSITSCLPGKGMRWVKIPQVLYVHN